MSDCNDCDMAGRGRWYGYWHGCTQCDARHLSRDTWMRSETLLQQYPESEREPMRQAAMAEWHRVSPKQERA